MMEELTRIDGEQGVRIEAEIRKKECDGRVQEGEDQDGVKG